MTTRRIKFKDFVTLQRGFDLPKTQRRPGPFPVVASTAIQDTHDEYKVKPPGVTTGRSGSLGEVLFIERPFWPLNTVLWVKEFKGNEPKYVYYFLKTMDLARWNAGTGVPTLNRNHLDQVDLNLHDLESQRKIASVLSAYDDLIENNTRRIRILEEMAQAIYREWFVNFRFPGHGNMKMVESELGLIPEGWAAKGVKHIVRRLTAGTVYIEADVAPTGSTPVIDQSKDIVLGFHENQPDHQAGPDTPIIVFGDHTCKMQLLVEPFSVGPNVVPFSGKDDVPIYYLFFLVKGLVSTQEYKRHWTELMAKTVVVAPPEIGQEFGERVRTIFELTDALTRKNANLRQTRDLLLLRLISGELDVSELDIKTEAVEV